MLEDLESELSCQMLLYTYSVLSVIGVLVSVTSFVFFLVSVIFFLVSVISLTLFQLCLQ